MSNNSSDAKKKYYLGLDIGTNSIGWAVTDENYHLIRKQGKHLWGSRLFSEAATAQSRRMQREARRRLERRRQRILLLQNIFSPEMEKIDPYFFDRLNNSALQLEDKPEALQTSPYTLFAGVGENKLTDKEYYDQYPTIYHLRLDLMRHPEKKFDLREIYLALAHMVKYRGNFLYEGEMSEESISSPESLKESFDALDEALADVSSSEEEEEDIPDVSAIRCSLKQANEIIALFQKEGKISLLQDGLKANLPEASKDASLWNVLKAITGSSLKLSALFPELKETLEEEDDLKVDFSDEDGWEKILLSAQIGEKRLEVLKRAKALYDARILIRFLKGKNSLSEAMVDRYELHHRQLVQLKKLWKEAIAKASTPEQKKIWKANYDSFFRVLHEKGEKDDASYSNYIGFTSEGGKKDTQSLDPMHRATTREDLYKKLLSKDFLPDGLLDSPSEEGNALSIRQAIAEENYLLRLNAKENGAFPYQLNLREMKIILDNQKAYYPFLGEKTKDFANPNTESYRICSLLEYRVPYYVGPLSQRDWKGKEPIRWACYKKGKEGVRITPWNFHDVIDEKASAKGFLDRLKSTCTYLIGEKTLPLASLTYQKYMVYNEMNGWLINGAPITTEDKDYLMDNLYRLRRGVSLANIENVLKRKYGQVVSLETTGTKRKVAREDIHANLSTYYDLKPYLGENFDRNPKKAELAEEIVEVLTAFEDRKMRYESLCELGLPVETAKQLSNRSYAGWGKLSEKFLTGLKTELVNTETGEAMEYSILDLLHLTPQNMMAIYFNSQYSFQAQVEKANEERKPSLEEILDADYTSPAMKRSLLQCVKHIIPELKKILGIEEFTSYFIEFTRQPDAIKKRTDSRKKFLDQVYSAAKKTLGEDDGFKNAEEELNKLSQDPDLDDKLRNRKLYYYFMQLGRDVYTGEKIQLDVLLSRNSDYDIDHIIPQAMVKDDSFMNTVLVSQASNRNKSDTYPIPRGIVTENGKKWIQVLNSIHIGNQPLMPKEKMERILRTETNPLQQDEVIGFVNRQLTMTNQSTKAVADVLRISDPHARIIYSKAENVSEFRRLFNIPKCREVNDYHHAHDAYLNIVVGNVYDMVFSHGNNRKFTAEGLEWKKSHNESLKTSVDFLFTRDERKFMSDKLVWKSKRYELDSQNHPLIDPETGSLKEKIEEPLGDPSRHNLPTIDLIRKTIAFNDPMVTQMVSEQSQSSGFFSKVTLHSAKAGNASYPLKQKAPFNTGDWAKKYGGYGDLVTPYFMLVKSEGKKDKKTGKIHHLYSIEGIPSIYLAGKDKKEAIFDYLVNNLGLKNPEIVIPKLLIRTALELPSADKNSFVRVSITGRTGSYLATINLTELHLPQEQYAYFKKIARVLGTNSSANEKPDLEKYKNIGHDSICIHSYPVLTENENLKTFDVLVSVLQRPCFKNLPEMNNVIETLPSKREAFASLDTLKQAIVLQSVLELVSCKPVREDLSAIGLSKALGSKRTSKYLPAGTKIIFTSATGFYEKAVFTVPED